MRVRAVVTSVGELPPREGQAPEKTLVSVSLEGFSVLLDRTLPVPTKGVEIDAVVSVRWRDGKRPIHWLSHWSEAI